jgi:hypothetical protein
MKQVMAASTRSAGCGQSTLRLEKLPAISFLRIPGLRSAGLGQSLTWKSICFRMD